MTTLSIEALGQASSLAEAQAAFGDYLGLDAPVPAGVIRHAFADQYFRHNLILNRGRPEALQQLLRHPRNAEFDEAEPQEAEAAPAAGPARGAAELATTAGKALYAWAKTGFALLDDAAFEARFSACERCDLLSAPPDNWVYALTSKRGDPRVCGACGCVAARKARMASERCPRADPANPALTRWGEPARGAAKLAVTPRR
jgi:hypothetical protein